MTVTVYTKPRCTQCNHVKGELAKHGIEYEEAPINDRVLTLARIKGWTAAPIVVSKEHPEYSFSGAETHQVEDFIAKHQEG